MVDRMRASEEGRKMRVNGVWNARLIRRYVRKVDKFLELLLFVTHTTAGQPARGTEITTVRYQNGFLQDRNVFVIDGRVVLITRYHKSQSQFDKPKIIPRFLPWRVGQLISVYLAYVQRFREHLMVQVQGEGWSDHVWANANGPWETDRLTSTITRETASRLGNRLTTLDYRHAAISIGRVFVGEPFAHRYREEVGEVEEPEVELEDALELHAGWGEKIGAQRYGVPSDIVKHLSIRSMETFRPLSEAWHRFLTQIRDSSEPSLEYFAGAAISMPARTRQHGADWNSFHAHPGWNSFPAVESAQNRTTWPPDPSARLGGVAARDSPACA